MQYRRDGFRFSVANPVPSRCRGQRFVASRFRRFPGPLLRAINLVWTCVRLIK